MIETRVVEVTISLDTETALRLGVNSIDAVRDRVARDVKEYTENLLTQVEQSPNGPKYVKAQLGFGVSSSRVV